MNALSWLGRLLLVRYCYKRLHLYQDWYWNKRVKITTSHKNKIEFLEARETLGEFCEIEYSPTTKCENNKRTYSRTNSNEYAITTNGIIISVRKVTDNHLIKSYLTRSAIKIRQKFSNSNSPRDISSSQIISQLK